MCFNYKELVKVGSKYNAGGILSWGGVLPWLKSMCHCGFNFFD